MAVMSEAKASIVAEFRKKFFQEFYEKWIEVNDKFCAVDTSPEDTHDEWKKLNSETQETDTG